MTDEKKVAQSFRISMNGMLHLDELSQFLTDSSRSDICSAALNLYISRLEQDGVTSIMTESQPNIFSSCQGIVHDFLTESYKSGSTQALLRLVHGENIIDIPYHTLLKFIPPYTMRFNISGKITIALDLSLQMTTICEDIRTGITLVEAPDTWSRNVRLTIDLMRTPVLPES